MDSSKLAVKLFVQDSTATDARSFVPLFHEWIQTHAIANHLLIDVADYRHVENGPGIVLVAHEGNFSMDATEGRLGLLYTRKQPLIGNFAARLQQTIRTALQAAALIESTPALEGKVRFRTDNMLIRINDRLAAPNTPETWNAVRPDMEDLLSRLYEDQLKFDHQANPETLFQIQLKVASQCSLATLVKRI